MIFNWEVLFLLVAHSSTSLDSSGPPLSRSARVASFAQKEPVFKTQMEPTSLTEK